MPSKNKQYNLVQSDDLDTRVPLMPEDAFQHGIPFNCKFIGSMDIPRPTSRVEIVAAMRRVRVEFKSKGVKKKKVTLTVAVDGIKTTLRKKNRKRKKRNSSAYLDVDGSNMVILTHPIYRIFYVSHDSQDVKIFSYIARETSSNLFHCCVFKAANKNQAMRIVRTVGQAFEVCHKLVGVAGEDDDSELQESDNLSAPLVDSLKISGESKLAEPPIIVSEKTREPSNGSNASLTADAKVASSSSSGTPPVGILASSLTALHSSDTNFDMVPEQVSHLVPDQSVAMTKPKPRNLDLNKRDILSGDLMGLTTPGSSAVPTPTQPQSFFKDISERVGGALGSIKGKLDKENLAQAHECQLLKEQLEQQTQNTRAALAQIQLLRDQLAAESAARIEAQARTHQLLIHNKELLDHLQTLVRHIQELEAGAGGVPKDNKGSGSIHNSIAAATGVTLPQVYKSPPTSSSGHHSQTPTSTPPPSNLPISFQEIESLRRQNATLLETLIYENNARSSYYGTIPHHANAARYAYPYGYPQLPPPQAAHLMYPFGNAASKSLIVTNNGNQSQSSSTCSSRGVLGDTSSSEMLATVFTSAGQPVLRNDPSPFIKPLENEGASGVLKGYLVPPPFGIVPKLGQIGRNASADYDQAAGLDDSNLRRNVLGRSVSEKIGHKSELMSQLTPRSKIERWFSFVVPPGEVPEEEDEVELFDRKGLRLSRRTLLSNKESGFVSEELNSERPRRKSPRQPVIVKATQKTRKARPKSRLSSTSSWLRRVLRLKRERARRLDYWNNDYAVSSSTGRNNRSGGHGVRGASGSKSSQL